MSGLEIFALQVDSDAPFLAGASHYQQGTTLPSLVGAVGVAVAVLDVSVAETDELGRTADARGKFVVGKEIRDAVGVGQFDGDECEVLTVGFHRCAVGSQAVEGFLDQPFVKDDKKKVSQVMAEVAKAAGGKLEVAEYVYYKLGDNA